MAIAWGDNLILDYLKLKKKNSLRGEGKGCRISYAAVLLAPTEGFLFLVYSMSKMEAHQESATVTMG